MSNKTRKHIWPVSLVMSIAIIGVLAAFVVLANNPGSPWPRPLSTIRCALDLTDTGAR